MLPVTVRVSAWSNGTLMQGPALLTEVGLREAMLILTDFDEEKVNLICRKVTEDGQCRLLSADHGPELIVEKILHS